MDAGKPPEIEVLAGAARVPVQAAAADSHGPAGSGSSPEGPPIETGLMHRMGIHPLAAFALWAVDGMLFAGEASTLGASWLVSLPVGAVLGAGTALLQRRLYGDEVPVAVTKGALLGLLTAIPTAIPGVAALGPAVLGGLAIWRRRRGGG